MKKILRTALSLVMAGAMTLSQATLPTFAGELTAEELYEKYAFTYDCSYNEGLQCWTILRSEKDMSDLNDEQRAEFVARLKAAQQSEEAFDDLMKDPYAGLNIETKGVYEGFRYTLFDENSIMVTGADYDYLLEHSPNELRIPDEIDGKPVIAIGSHAFHFAFLHDIHFENVIIPDTVEYIFNSAFDHCGAKAINLPKHIKYLGYRSFLGCVKQLAKSTSGGNIIIMPESLEYLDSYALSDTQLTFSNGLDDNGVLSLDGLLRVQMPESLVFMDYADIGGDSWPYPDDVRMFFVDENDVPIDDLNNVREKGFTDQNPNVVTYTNALQYIIDRDNLGYDYEAGVRTIHVYLGDLEDTEAVAAFEEKYASENKNIFSDWKTKRFIYEQKQKRKRWVRGDVNCDGNVSISDAVLLARLVAEDTAVTVTEQGMENADLNGDGELTSDDTTQLLKLITILDSNKNS